jgi:hypothetical protein
MAKSTASCIRCHQAPQKTRRLCHRCYMYHWSNDDLSAYPTRNVSVKIRLQQSAEGRTIHECHPWNGTITDQGYGQAGSSRSAHLEAWLAAGNPRPKPGQHLDHTCCWKSDCNGGSLCPHRRCVNARHLRVVSARDNVMMAPHIRRGICRRGHPRTPVHGYRQARGKWRCCSCDAITLVERQLKRSTSQPIH